MMIILASDEKTGASDDWGRGHLFRSGRSSNTQIYRKYFTKEMSSNQNFDRKSRASRNMEHSLYKKVCQSACAKTILI